MGSMRRAQTAVATVLFGPALLLAIQTPQPPVFRSGVELIDVAVVVCDEQGRFVSGLTPADFEISERGVRQTITVFDRVSIPVWRAEHGTTAPPVPADVSTNERLADGRIFVLILDALHVSPSSLGALKRHARQFIEEHVGSADLAAVLSPGAIDAASQDFTSDKARLLAAIDSFSGTKVRSATIELEEERRLAAAGGGVIMHGGKDPSDAERADRAQSLYSVLDALAGHLSRVERRRKALLLFSEGVDYNLGDLMGGVQQQVSEVLRAMDRAVGALMRSNVSLYAIDPRALASADTASERVPFRPAPNAPRADGSLPRMDLSEPSLEREYAASVQSLRDVSEPTGGFAAVTSNDVTAAFERIVQESSDYYVIGYTPAKRGKPGEFQPIRVRVARPGVRVIARTGYLVSRVPSQAASAEPLPTELAPRSMGSRQRPGRVEFPTTETAAPTPRGLPAELATLLSSPLPVAGLPLRVQATPFKGNGKKQLVQLVTEVLGSSIAFVERGGRYESRVELASFTVDSRGHGANGRSTTIDMRLTRDEFERAKATGIRWISQLQLAPGRYQLRVAARAPATGAAGLVTRDVYVPSFADGTSLSGVVLTSAPSVLMVTRGQSRLRSALGTPPTAARSFVAGDRIVAAVEAYVPASGPAATGVTAEVMRIDGGVVLQLREEMPSGGRPGTSEVRLPIDTSSMSPGLYVLHVRLDGAQSSEHADRRVPFEIVASPGR